MKIKNDNGFQSIAICLAILCSMSVTAVASNYTSNQSSYFPLEAEEWDHSGHTYIEGTAVKMTTSPAQLSFGKVNLDTGNYSLEILLSNWC